MVWQAMGEKWTGYGFQFFYFMFSILVLKIQGFCTLNSEGLALFQFRAKVEVDPFGALANWDPNDCDPCMWSGIECLEGKVVMLNQSGRDLEGVLGPELGNLAHLRILDLSKNHLSGNIPPQFGQLMALEVLDLRSNNFSGMVPSELGRLHSLKSLLLCNNNFEGSIPMEIRKLNLLSDFQFDGILSPAAGIRCVNRKLGHFIWQSIIKQSKKSDSFKQPPKWSLTGFINLLPMFRLGSDSSHEHENDSRSNHTGVIRHMLEQESIARPVLAEQPTNLKSLPPNIDVRAPFLTDPSVIPSRSSGSFPAVPVKKPSPPAPPPTSGLADSTNRGSISSPNDKEASTGGNSGVPLMLMIGISVLALIIAAILLFVCRCKAKAIRPWRSELSGQLRKAFLTGVPKLSRSELETACEDFSNIVYVRDNVSTLYKGILSSGVEIAVATTAIPKERWSKRSEMVFRKQIESLSRVNHKNFVNLLGYCEEEEPFTRMMVFEYAPNGTLFEHLHVSDIDHLNWNARMRIIMGVAYCLQHLHGLNPPLAHIYLSSQEVFLTDDYAAKVADVSFWRHLISTAKNPHENDMAYCELPQHSSVEMNILNFGVLLLEIVSGRFTYSKEQGDILKWADSYLNDKNTINQLIDPSLESFNDNQLDTLCEAIQSCTQENPQKRPSMTKVINDLRQALDISPEVAYPKLSPLWWAELEIVSSDPT